MRAVVLGVSEAELSERRRLGLDGRDELWDGVLHMVPPAGGPHQSFGTDLLLVLGPIAKELGLHPTYETGLYRTDNDYRVPDQLYCRPEHKSKRGAEGAELVIEIRSPDDESYEKIDWYAARSVREMLIAHPDERRVELFRLVGGKLRPVTPDADGSVRSEVFGVCFLTCPGRLRLTWDDGTAEF